MPRLNVRSFLIFGRLAAASVAPCGLPEAAHADEPGLWERPTLGGDVFGLRPLLAERGIGFTVHYIGETLGNVAGGVRRDLVYEGRFELSTDVDLDKLAGLAGGSFHAGAYLTNGHGLSADNVPSIMPASNIEARSTERLFTLWYQQEAMHDRLSLRIGQLAADDEFLLSPTAGTFINGTFGWAALAASNLPSGGPAYPLAAPGARLRVGPADDPSLQLAAFAGDPAGRGTPGDPQKRDDSGTTFSTEGGALLIAEAHYPVNHGKDAKGLPGVYKLGGWYHTGSFDDLRFDNVGTSLESPASNGTPRSHRGNFGIYAVADHMLWRRAGTDDQGLSAFLRVGGAPSDRNLVSFYSDGGVAFKGPFAGRPNDTIALGAGMAFVSGGAAARDRDRNAFNGLDGPVRDSETVIELTYSAEITPWWLLQPDLQYVRRPAGGTIDPTDANGRRAVGDAIVVGLRTSLKL